MHQSWREIEGRRTSNKSNGLYLQWTLKLKHNSITDDIDYNVKRSLFNGYVHKLKANFGNLQSSILMNLFKSYCCITFVEILYRFIL